MECLNKYLMSVQFQDCSKKLRSLPVSKKDGPLEKKNYRPVSILSLLPKVYENLLYS